MARTGDGGVRSGRAGGAAVGCGEGVEETHESGATVGGERTQILGDEELG